MGYPAAVREFVCAAGQRLGLQITPEPGSTVFRIAVGDEATAALPPAVRLALPTVNNGVWRVAFTSPTPEEGVEYLGRNHPFVATLATFLLEEALTKGAKAAAARCGVVRTRAVERLTTILVLRVRYLLHQPERAPLLAEEAPATGYRRNENGALDWLTPDAAVALLERAQPDANISPPEKRELATAALSAWATLDTAVQEQLAARAAELVESHKRIRRAVGLRVRDLRVTPQFPPDLLGLLALQPVVR